MHGRQAFIVIRNKAKHTARYHKGTHPQREKNYLLSLYNS